MVRSVLILLFWPILASADHSVYDRILADHELDESPQIHYQHCDRKYNCLVPSKYFNRTQEKSLYITATTTTQFLDGIEIYAVSSSEWHMTLMANISNGVVEFTWGPKTFLKCHKDTKKGDLVSETDYSTVTAMTDRFLTFKDPEKGGNQTSAMICKFKLERKSTVSDQTMSVIFAALVHKTKNQQMCLKITGDVNETFCNFIEDLEPNLHIAFNPRLCSGCPLGERMCKGSYNTDPNDPCSWQRLQKERSALIVQRPSGCEYFFSTKIMLVNNQFYAEPGSQILCHENQWVMLRYNPLPTFDDPYGAKEQFVEKITSVVGDPGFDCRYSSPLRSLCQGNINCLRIKDWKWPLSCEDETHQLTYYGKTLKRKIVLSEATCNEEKGIWTGQPLEPKAHPVTYTLRAGDNIVCENPDEEAFEDDEIDLDSDASRQAELLRRDDAKNYTSLIVIGTVVGVLGIIVIIIISVLVASCVGSGIRQPIGLPKSERSQRPLRAAGEEQMSFSDRVSLMLTLF